MKRLQATAVAGITAAIAWSAAAGQAGAVTWTPVQTGTTEAITAIDYTRGQLRFVTGAGNIFVRRPDGSFALEASFPGRQFFDIAFRPSGDVGLASADSGQLFRYSGGAWAPVSLANASFDDSDCTGDPVRPATPTGNLLAVSWGTDDAAWVVSSGQGQVLRSLDAGATFKDVSRQPDGRCRLDATLTDVAAIPGSPNDAWFVSDTLTPWRTADGLATAVARTQLLENCDYTSLMRLATDPAGQNRIGGVGNCAIGVWGFSSDAGTTATELVHEPPTARDVAAGPGVFLAVGDEGSIRQTFDGVQTRRVDARGALAHNQWLSVEFADRAHAAVGGADGALVVTSNADPRPTFVFSGVRARRSGGRVTVRIRGRLRVPKGVSAATACQGQVLLTVKRGRRQLAARNARIRPSCRFSKTVRLSRRAVGRARRLTVIVRFGGNAQLGVRRKTLHVRVR